ncbi:MAG: GNAT family N-acetyltransferase [Anaerolineales bacterium]|nr:GNAT family N-acetyltransferase [Anaerolineales bacterium]
MVENLIQKRQSIQHLLNTHSPGDALANYYALNHPDDRTILNVHRNKDGRADGFLSICRTGIDLFRPLLTLKAENQTIAAELLDTALPPKAAVIIAVPLDMAPIIDAFFTISGETSVQVYRLEPGNFEPIINVLVTRAPTPGGDPRFVVREQSFDRGAQPKGPTIATAGINWRSPQFADIYVHTEHRARGRGLGKSVVSSLCNWLLEQNITPLYSAGEENQQSISLARGLGFRPTGVKNFICDGIRRTVLNTGNDKTVPRGW